MVGGDGSTPLRMCLIPLNYTVKMVKMVNFVLCVFYHNKNLEKNKTRPLSHTIHKNKLKMD